MKNVLCVYLIQLEHQSKMKNLYKYYIFVDMFKYISWTLNTKMIDEMVLMIYWYTSLIVAHLCNYILLKTNFTCLNSLNCDKHMLCYTISWYRIRLFFFCFIIACCRYFFHIQIISLKLLHVQACNVKSLSLLYISNLVHTAHFWNNLPRIAGSQKIEKSK